MRNSRRSNPDGLSTKGALGRAMRYLSHYRRQAALPYLFLVIATLAGSVAWLMATLWSAA